MHMPRGDAHLLGTPTILPEGKGLVGLGDVFGVVVAGDVAKAEEDIWEAILIKH